MNRKFLSFILAAAMLMANGAVFADEVMLISENPAAEQTEAEVTENFDKVILEGTADVTDEGELYIIDADGNETVLLTAENTIIMTADGNKISLSEIQDGDEIKAVTSNAMTASLPPQTRAYVIIKKTEGAEFPIYAEVKSVETDEDGNKVFYSADGKYKVVCGEETEVAPFATKNIVRAEDITEGVNILVYSNIMTMSIPAMVPAEKIMILPELDDETEVEAEPEKVFLNGVELDVEIQNVDGVYLLPVRKISETAGFVVDWDDSLQAVTVGTTAMGVTFRIDENSYTKSKMMPMTLSSAPLLINDLTYVPTDFFADVLGAEVEKNDGAFNITLSANLD